MSFLSIAGMLSILVVSGDLLEAGEFDEEVNLLAAGECDSELDDLLAETTSARVLLR